MTTELIGYHAMRLRWCRLALLQFLRRWGIYIVVAAMVVGAGANSPVHAVAGVAAWTVMPVFAAAARGPLWLLPAAATQALLGLACVWGLRALLWPPRWRDAEAALPIAPREQRRSDAVVVVFALLPIVLLQVAGTGAMLSGQRGVAAAVVALVLANGAAWALGVAMLQRLRRPIRGAVTQTAAAARGPGRVRGGWVPALLLRPLWRGPARRSGRLLALGSAGLVAPALALFVWPTFLPWCLAAVALIALVIVTRLQTLSREEFAPLFEATAMLPLQPQRLEHGRAALCLLPLAPAALALAPGLARSAARPGVLAAYAVALFGACAVEVFSRPPREPSDKAARWLFSLVLCLALASEVAR